MTGATIEPELHVEPQSLKKLSFTSLKRSLEFFSPAHSYFPPPGPERKVRLSHKISMEYGGIKGIMTQPSSKAQAHQPSSTSNVLALTDSPPPPPVDVGSGTSSSSDASNDPCSSQFHSGQADDANQNDDNNDRVGKKRERQLKNKDAAVRSREKKKMYVRDLELKSRYYEAECKRLGMILQCCHAENQALRFSLQNSGAAFAASATMQESAVLL